MAFKTLCFPPLCYMPAGPLCLPDRYACLRVLIGTSATQVGNCTTVGALCTWLLDGGMRAHIGHTVDSQGRTYVLKAYKKELEDEL